MPWRCEAEGEPIAWLRDPERARELRDQGWRCRRISRAEYERATSTLEPVPSRTAPGAVWTWPGQPTRPRDPEIDTWPDPWGGADDRRQRRAAQRQRSQRQVAEIRRRAQSQIRQTREQQRRAVQEATAARAELEATRAEAQRRTALARRRVGTLERRASRLSTAGWVGAGAGVGYVGALLLGAEMRWLWAGAGAALGLGAGAVLGGGARG